MSESEALLQEILEKQTCTCQDKACYANGGYIFSYGQLGPWHEEECDFYTPF